MFEYSMKDWKQNGENLYQKKENWIYLFFIFSGNVVAISSGLPLPVSQVLQW